MSYGNLSDDGSKDVVLSIPRRSLGEFLAGLLGNKREVSKEFDCRFKVNLQWLHNVFHLVEQRIASQNNGKLINIKAEMFYENGKKVD